MGHCAVAERGPRGAQPASSWASPTPRHPSRFPISTQSLKCPSGPQEACGTCHPVLQKDRESFFHPISDILARKGKSPSSKAQNAQMPVCLWAPGCPADSPRGSPAISKALLVKHKSGLPQKTLPFSYKATQPTGGGSPETRLSF